MSDAENAREARLTEEALDLLFRQAHTHSSWLDRPVPAEILREIYDLAKWGPTSANSSPARFVFVTTPEAKERLLTAVAPGNLDKTRTAPVNVIVAWDTQYYDELPRLFPHVPGMRSFFADNRAMAEEAALRNGSLQGGYFILAARGLGLDCGPMSGFDAAQLNAEFFPDGRWKANFLLNLGYGDPEKLFPRNPRLEFDEACQVL
jgi:3-hydroxypropanoate dehydrogenase